MDTATNAGPVQWGSPDWGKPGHNVHGLDFWIGNREPRLAVLGHPRVTESSSGSWLEGDK